MRLVTHNARFHADDVFAAATLLEIYPEAEIVRTRDPEIIDAADIVFDVGTIYDEQTRFDHHQQGGAGKRDNGIPYASFGLVWKKYGATLCSGEQAAGVVDRKLVQPIDAMDNGLDISTAKIEDVHAYTIQSAVFSFGPTWKEAADTSDGAFLEVVDFARKVLRREIAQAKDFIDAEEHVLAAYARSEDRRIVEIDANYPWTSLLVSKPEPLYVVRPNVQTPDWKVEAVPTKLMTYDLRKKLPEPWAGKRDEELAEVTGVEDAVFCHNGRFLAVAKTREGALRLAKIAVESV